MKFGVLGLMTSLISMSASAQELHKTKFLLNDVSLLDAKRAETCISYHSCDVIAVALPDGGNFDVFKMVVTGADKAKAVEILSACGLKNSLEGKIYDYTSKEPVALAVATRPVALPAIAYLTNEFFQANENRIRSALTGSLQDSVKATVDLSLIFGVDPSYVDQTLVEFPEAETECDAWIALRHRLEISTQIHFAKSCAAQNKTHSFQRDDTREMNASLGDAAFTAFACKGMEKVEMELNAASSILEISKMR